MYKCKHFKLQELVSKQVYDKYREKAWQFFDDRALKTIDWIWDTLAKEKGINPVITINTWSFVKGGSQQQGFRSNLEPLVMENTNKVMLYCTQHGMGRGFDMNIKGMTADEFRQWAREHENEFPYPVWIENNVTWEHLDTRQSDKEKVYFFNS